MIVHDLDLLGSRFAPPEYDPPLIVDSDRMLTGEVASQRLQAISWWCGEIAEHGSVVELHQFAASNLGKICRETLWNAPLRKDQLGERATEAPDHRERCII